MIVHIIVTHPNLHPLTHPAADDPPLTEEQTMTLTAGEIIALLEGKRAVVMVQVCC